MNLAAANMLNGLVGPAEPGYGFQGPLLAGYGEHSF